MHASGIMDKYAQFLDEKEDEAKKKGYVSKGYTSSIDTGSLEDMLVTAEDMAKLKGKFKEEKKKTKQYKRRVEELENSVSEVRGKIARIEEEYQSKIRGLQTTLDERNHQLERACKLLKFEKSDEDDEDEEDSLYEIGEEERQEEQRQQKLDRYGNAIPLSKIVMMFFRENPNKEFCANELKKCLATYAPKHGFYGKLYTVTARLSELHKRDQLQRVVKGVNASGREKFVYSLNLK